jgi:twinkle protein
MQISQEHMDWLESRGVDPEIALRLEVFSGDYRQTGEGKDRRYQVFADERGKVLAFPTLIGGKAVGEHYRIDPCGDEARGKKLFRQRKGSPQVFWNFECLLDPALERGEPLIITEGQIDALTAITCGFPFAVSMPSGSDKPPEGRLPEDLDPLDRDSDDRPSGRFGSLYHARAQLKAVRKIIIATDSDDNGIRLAAELVRRLGAGRCYRAEYPSGCKDLNDVVRKHSREAVVRCIAMVKPYPTKGVYRMSDFQEQSDPATWDTGWPDFDQHCKLAEGMFVPVVGIPMSGKSLFVLNWLVRVALRHNVVVSLTSFETGIKPVIQQRLRWMACERMAWQEASFELKTQIDRWIEEHFVFVEYNWRVEDESDMTIEWYLDNVHDALMRYNARIHLVDPWNEIEHARASNESQSEYQNRALRKLKGFCKRHSNTIICVAHPTKDVHEKGKIRRPNLYDADGSSAWKNKADLGVIVHRPDMNANITEIAVDKVKYEFMGKIGMVHFQHNKLFRRFEEVVTQEDMLAA